jgi:hypothetical protein
MAVTTAQQTAIANLYIALFNRAPDAAGLEFWATALSNGASLSTVSQSLLANAEAKVIYPGAQTSEQFVTAFYQTVFGRTVDTAGLAFWTGVLNAAGGPTSDAAKALFVSKIVDVASTPVSTKPDGLTDAQYAQTLLDRDTLAKKVVIALDFAVTQKSNDLTAAKLAFVVSTPTTPDAPVAGTTIRLTTLADTLVGGAGNDIFDGSLNSGVGTLSSTDNLDGGAGIDTLNATLISSSSGIPTLRNIEIVNLTSPGSGAVLDLVSSTGVTNVNIVNSSSIAYVLHVGTAALSVANQNSQAGFSGSTGSVLSLTLDTVGQDDGKLNLSLNANGNAPLATTYNLVAKDAYVNLSGATAGSYTVAATGVNILNLGAANVHTLDVTGAGSVDFTGVSLSALTRFTAQDGGVKLVSTGTGLVTVTTGAGADIITANATSLTTLNVGAGNDIVTLSAGALSATARVDLGAGNDTITLARGSVSGATVNGGAGDDIINTGATTVGSLDTLTGGTGNDTFSFNTADVNTTAGVVTAIITDFQTGADKIKITIGVGNYPGTFQTFVKAATFDSLPELLAAAAVGRTGFNVYYVGQVGADSYLVADGNLNGYTSVIKLVGVAVSTGIFAADLIGNSIII